jgi:hypothetical protein
VALTWYPYISRAAFDTNGINDAFVVTHESIAKECTDQSPYLIPNEWIAGSIASFLRLPVPPFAMIRRETHKGMFASLRFGRRASAPKDMNPGPCVRNHPRLCTGILLFDILIANGDRHRTNLIVDNKHDPKEIIIIDSERSLFGAGLDSDKLGIARLRRRWDNLGVSDGTGTGDSRNCFLGVLNTVEFFEEWIQKIGMIPDWFFQDICDEVSEWINAEEKEVLLSFLKDRRIKLRDIISKNKQAFTAIKEWGLFL